MDITSYYLSDYYHLKKQIESEFVVGADGQLSKSFLDLPKLEQQSKLKERLKKYCQKVFFFSAKNISLNNAYLTCVISTLGI